MANQWRVCLASQSLTYQRGRGLAPRRYYILEIFLFPTSCLMKKIALLFALILFAVAAYAQDAPAAQDKKDSPAAVSPTQSDNGTRIQALEMQLRSLADEVAALQAELRELRKASSSAPTVN